MDYIRDGAQLACQVAVEIILYCCEGNPKCVFETPLVELLWREQQYAQT